MQAAALLGRYRFIVLFGCALMLSACTGQMSSRSSNSSFISGQSVFKDTADRVKTPELDRSQNPESGRNRGPESERQRQPEAPQIERKCSDDKTEEYGNVQEAETVRLAVYSQDDVLVCTQHTKDYKADLINLDRMAIELGCTLADGRYELLFYDPNRVSSLIKRHVEDNALGELDAEVRGGVFRSEDSKLEIIYARNPRKDDLEDIGGQDYQKCDEYASPLAIKLDRLPGSLSLSAPLDGIKFNILGWRDPLGAHLKRQISWPRLEATVAFVTLPNSQGQVLGIDQLFGDNTKGPDGRFASNGYAALAKYDKNADGKISGDDPVFSRLRLWTDMNRNGVSEPTELVSFKTAGITVLDLEYDASFYEKDQYGNEILYKSVVELKSGQKLLVFDIWFRLIE